MDTMRAFIRGELSKGKELMVFDWDKATQIIKEKSVSSASAGLSGDWEWTGGEILINGKPIPENDTYVYLASTWATPELEVDGEIIDCFKMQSETNNWNAHTFWPESALKILNG